MKLNVKIDNQSFAVEVGDLSRRPVPVTVDGETFEVWPEQATNNQPAANEQLPGGLPAGILPVASTLPVMPAPAGAAQPAAGVVNKMRVVVAPIPGVIIAIHVKAGDTVAFGQELCVLEAMKMKNLIRANRAGVIAAVLVSTGDQVKHGQVLMEYSD